MGMTFDRCPIATLRDEQAAERELASDVMLFREHGVMPNAGGLLEQDARWVDALTLVGNEVAAIRSQAVPNGG